MPGRKSLAEQEYYAHPANQFWRILAALHSEPVPQDYAAKKLFLSRCRIALWDVLETCERKASEDASIRADAPNYIPALLQKHRKIRRIILNGKAAEKYYRKHFAGSVQIPAVYAPSTSPAHAALRYEEKLQKWKNVLQAEI